MAFVQVEEYGLFITLDKKDELHIKDNVIAILNKSPFKSEKAINKYLNKEKRKAEKLAQPIK